MTVKPLSEEELVAAREYEDVGNTHSVIISSTYKEQRLKELFAELKKLRCNGFCDIENNGDFVEFTSIEELFGPLVPK